MTFQELLIMFGAPILVVVAVFAVIFLRHPRPQSRYRPGEPYSFKPVWFIARDGAVGAPASHASGELESAESGEAFAGGPKGGAHGKW
ncbi:hypothetical protein [Glycomyces buryatensis]|uniref:Uncharacterized protein n=1 Tax=Glycomyces buryatensis TaxID=2570927 RepID=A0A4S8Q9N2_9ACTN|nr:hypothetical protein [Glycomyces buryatensis]THV39445.1 hypothetical protein FAB82_17660 [Glycomyces buryatensis]